MQVRNSNISFGTKVLIGDYSITTVLPEYPLKLAKGLKAAAEKLTANGVADQVVISLQPHFKKNHELELAYWPTEDHLHDSISLKLSELIKLSARKISKIIVDSYKKLERSLPVKPLHKPKPEIKIKKPKLNAKQLIIAELARKYGVDDSSLFT